MFFRLGIFALVIAGVLGFVAYNEGTLARQSSAEPEVITLKKLIARGPDGNAHVIVTDFVLCDNFVQQFKKNQPNVWTGVWIPAVPADMVPANMKVPPRPEVVQALFFSGSIINERELNIRFKKAKVQGLITNRIAALDPEIRKLLQASYPGTDFDTCLIIQEGRTPFARGHVFLTAAGAAVCLLAAVGLFLGAFVRRRS